MATIERAYVEGWLLYSAVTFHLIWWGLPAYIMWRPARTGGRMMGKRFFFATVGTWVALCIHRIFVGEEIQRVYVVACSYDVFGEGYRNTNDGQVETLIIFGFGIFFAAASSGIAWLLWSGWKRLHGMSNVGRAAV